MNQIVDQYILKTEFFIALLEREVNNLKIKESDLTNNTMSLEAKMKANDSKYSAIMAQISIMERERDEALLNSKVSARLTEQAKEDLDKASRMMSEVLVRTQELDEQEAKIKKLSRDKTFEIEAQDRLKKELETLQKDLETKKAFIESQSKLLDDKKLSLDDRERKLMKLESRLKLVRDKPMV